ncbi:response regulator [Klebsiella pneumoniae]
MTNYSLRARMMILILAPTVLIGLLLSIFFVAHRYNDLQRQLEDAGASIIEPLAVSSEYGMNLQNRESIGQLISVLHRRHSEIVRAISVYDSHNRLFVTSNYQLNPSELQIPKGEAFPRHLSVIRDGDMMILRTPIVSESYSPDESPESDAKMPGNMLGYVALELDLKSVRLQQYKEIFISSVMMLFCIGIALIFGWRLMRDVTGPIRNMVNTVDRIRRGQLDSRVEGFMLGELDMLKNGINSMAMSLAAYHEEMQHNVDQATSDLRETLEQMEIQNVELDLPCHAQVSAEALKRDGVAACLLKPLTTTRLLPALVATSHALASAPLMQIDSHKLPMTVMAVDDNPANLKLIGALLDDLVQQVILCDSGQQAVDKAKQLQMDLILMDIQMPDMDGIRACELIHHLSHHQQTPVIAVTAHALEGQREKLLSAGMNDYLAKPIEEEKLHALLLRYQPGLHSVVPASLPPAEPIVDHNQTLDWQLALRQAAMKPDLAREMLQMLIAFMPEVRNKVEEQLVGEQPEGLVDLIHKLHGSCSYSGVPRLKKLCHTLESQLRAGTAAEDLEPELLELLDEMDNVAREACRMGV